MRTKFQIIMKIIVRRVVFKTASVTRIALYIRTTKIILNSIIVRKLNQFFLVFTRHCQVFFLLFCFVFFRNNLLLPIWVLFDVFLFFFCKMNIAAILIHTIFVWPWCTTTIFFYKCYNILSPFNRLCFILMNYLFVLIKIMDFF